MNVFMFFLICSFSLAKFIALSTHFFFLLNSASQDFKNQAVDCPQEASQFWESPSSNCIPPPTDHAAFYVPLQGAAPALCLLIQKIAEDYNITMTIRDSEAKELQCQYL